MSTIIIITPPPKKDPLVADAVAADSPASDYTAAIALIEAAEAVGSAVRVIHAD